MVFDEASSWWSSNKKLLPDSDVLKDELDLSHIQLSLDEAEGEANEDNIEEDVTQSPWQKTGGKLAISLAFRNTDLSSILKTETETLGEYSMVIDIEFIGKPERETRWVLGHERIGEIIGYLQLGTLCPSKNLTEIQGRCTGHLRTES
ncbi:hypothetical protein BC332_01549 [Capsicum chinense]|nr:hypothetical protein BC332_01549 [Capsicum chinense]